MPLTYRPRHQIACPLYGCGKMIDATPDEYKRGYVDYCQHCNAPIWPLEKGFTGNDPEATREFARTHTYDGTPLVAA